MNSKRERITVAEIASFFDEISQAFLDPFNWDPNPELPHGQRKTYTIQMFFKAKYHNRICLYFKDELDICKTIFHDIFSGNLIYGSQIDDIKNKIKRIVDSDNFYITGTMSADNNNTNTVTSNSNNTNKSVLDALSKFGGFKGELDATQLSTGLDKTRRLIETKQIIESSEDKVYGYLIPSRHVSHNVSIDKRDTTTTNTFNGNTSSTHTINGRRSMTHKKGATAMMELQALGVKLRQLRAEFLEQFNPLFHAV